MMSDEQRRLAAVMFTDIVGYSSLTQKNERLALELLEEHRRIVRPILARHNGREIKTIGDAFLIEFGSALEATECAVEIQRSLRDYNQQSDVARRVHIRIGIHLGDVIQRQNDVLGDAVNIASRIEPLAEADGICISGEVYAQVRNKIGYPNENLGPRHLKNIDYPIDVYRILWMKDETAKLSLDEKRIAVLPFANMSPDPADEYFADGMTEELIDRLAQVKSLKVIARTSVMSYKKKEKKASEIARELEVGTLVEGSVRKAGNRVRVTVQLINAGTEEHLWSSRYDKDLDDIFAVQTEIAEKVAGELKTQLLESEKRTLEKKPTEDIGAYALYLKGRYYWNKRSRDALEKAINYFREAIESDPSFALAYSGLADTYNLQVNHGYLPPVEGNPKIKEAARKAVELDGTVAEAHTSLGSILGREWDWIGAEIEFGKALRSNPSYVTAHHWYSIHLLCVGRLDEAMRELKIAEELDPLSPVIHGWAGQLYFFARQYEIALKELDKELDLDPSSGLAHYFRRDIYLVKGMFGEASAESQLWLSDLPPSLAATLEPSFRGLICAMSGRTEEAKRILRECEDKTEHERDEDTDEDVMANIAIIHSKLGEKDRALEWLKRCFEARKITPFQVKFSPFFDEITSDPRFEELMKKFVGSLGGT
jgi:TolB-like protein/Tfp pilus assembly protein PilF